MKLPVSWREVRLADVCELGSGDGAPQEEQWFVSDGNLFVRTSDVSTPRDGAYITNTRDKLSNAAVDQLRLRTWKRNSLLLPKSGASALLNQRALLGVDACVVAHLAVLSPSEQLHHEYLYWWSTAFDAARVVPDPSYPSIRLQDLGRVKLPFPTLPEQQRIVDVLRQAEVVTQLRQQFEDLLVRTKRQLFVEMFGDPNQKGNNDWPIVKLGSAVAIATGGTPSREQSGSFGGAIAWVKSTDLTDEPILLTDENLTELGIQRSNAKLHPKNTVLLAMYGQGQTRGRTGKLLVEAACNQACAALLPSEELLPDYLWVWLQLSYEKVRSLGRGGQQENLNLDIVRGIKLTKPPIQLQQEFSRRLGQLLSVVSTMQNAKQQTQTLLAALRVDALTGDATVEWRANHSTELEAAACERDALLSERGTKVSVRITETVQPERPTDFTRPARRWLIDELSEFQFEVWSMLRHEWRGSVIVDDPEVFGDFCTNPQTAWRIEHFKASPNRIRRALEQLAALGLIAKVSLPKANAVTQQTEYMIAYRPLRGDENTRLADVNFMRRELRIDKPEGTS